MTRLAVAATIAFAFALSAVSLAAAQGGPDVQISKLDCTGDPEIVELTNQGDADQNLTGWELQSDPEANEMFDLSGSLPGNGASITIQSGASASGIFVWSTSEVFRDNDSTDYVKLVDNSGAIAVTVDQVNCAGAAAEPSPAGEVPNGGGPPPPSADMLSPGMMVLIGGSLAAAGAAAVALPRLRLRYSPVAASPSSRSRSAAGRGRGGRDEKPGYLTLGLAAVALTVVMLFRFLRRRPD